MNRPSIHMRICGDGAGEYWLEYLDPFLYQWLPELTIGKQPRRYPNFLSVLQDVLSRVRLYHSPIWITDIRLDGESLGPDDNSDQLALKFPEFPVLNRADIPTGQGKG